MEHLQKIESLLNWVIAILRKPDGVEAKQYFSVFKAVASVICKELEECKTSKEKKEFFVKSLETIAKKVPCIQVGDNGNSYYKEMAFVWLSLDSENSQNTTDYTFYKTGLALKELEDKKEQVPYSNMKIALYDILMLLFCHFKSCPEVLDKYLKEETLKSQRKDFSNIIRPRLGDIELGGTFFT